MIDAAAQLLEDNGRNDWEVRREEGGVEYSVFGWGRLSRFSTTCSTIAVVVQGGELSPMGSGNALVL